MRHGSDVSPVSRSRKTASIAIVIAMVASPATVFTQSQPAPVPVARFSNGAMAAGDDQDSRSLRLLVGRSMLVSIAAPILRVSLTSSEIADALVTAPAQLLVHGKLPGTISMFVWERSGAIRRFEVTVERDLAQLTEQLKELFPNESITVNSTGKNIVLSGRVSSKTVAETAVNLAAGFVDGTAKVVDLLQFQAARSNQVLLRVRFAEVSRTAMTELGASFVANGFDNGRWLGRSTTQQFAAPQWDAEGRLVFSDFLNLFLFDSTKQLATVIRALQGRGLFQSLAEPNLVAESGKEASFLAGGEIPIPVAQGSGGNVAISVEYKEFGIRLNFTPEVVGGDRVRLKVRPEVSSLDFSNGIVLQGFRIPALNTRRTETELELNNGQTFAIAGLLDNSMNSSIQKIPGLGHIPILGLLFQSKAAQKNQTELVVMITPEILPLDSPGVSRDLPRLQEPYMAPLPEQRSIVPPPPAFGPSSSLPAPSTGPAGPAPASASPAEAVGLVGDASADGTPAGSATQTMVMPADLDNGPVGGDAPLSKAERDRQAKLAREQAKRDAEAAKRAEEQAKKQQELEKKQQELEKKQQKAIAEAEAKLKAALAAYEAQVAAAPQQ